MVIKRKKALFLDRDGVINETKVREGKSFAPIHLSEVNFLPGVRNALIKSRYAGFFNIIVTNQPDLSTGIQSNKSLCEIHDYMLQMLPIDDIFVCPHLDIHNCSCRKPKPGLLIDAASRWGVDLEYSFMVGDRWRDIEAGQLAGCKTSFFINNSYNEPLPKGKYIEVPSLVVAVNCILKLS